MKVASRFPIKESNGLLLMVNSLHLIILLLSFFVLGLSYLILIVVCSLIISYHFSIKQLKSITEGPDDLIWTGEQWLITFQNDKNKLSYQEPVYLEVLASSWVTSRFSLLKFSSESLQEQGNKKNQEFVWFFSASNLGDRYYRELCYLTKQSLREKTLLETDKID